MKRMLAMGLLLMTTLVVLSGCNTVNGMGEDIEQGGEAIQRSSTG
ncbi:entericidin A/B family lipoprotein [Halomonas dongshanensis]|uniref:Entericidin A/B family lipoprotein n=1 Tax=Halomonas dongshanensis TaxID=2890835 RepID=A0ABT2EIF0_9GAMM|nr:entericidin A/B family lipoprotein [Halomonas dongshanensis]MCS2610372.1 entericidin A/B family lipoprotein [Halomonas dongshanensis]